MNNIINEISKIKDNITLNKTYFTDRLVLVALKPNQTIKVLDYYTRNREFLKEWEPIRSESFYSYQFQHELLKKEHEEYKEKSMIRLWIAKKTNRDKVIGNICFSNIIYGNFLSCFLGYKLDKDEVNNGYITEAVEKGISIMFEEYKLHRIEANIIPENKRSIRVVEKIGFEKEGLSKRYLKINGEWRDHVHYAIYNDSM